MSFYHSLAHAPWSPAILRSGTCMGLPQGKDTCQQAGIPPEPPRIADSPMRCPGQILGIPWLTWVIGQSEGVPAIATWVNGPGSLWWALEVASVKRASCLVLWLDRSVVPKTVCHRFQTHRRWWAVETTGLNRSFFDHLVFNHTISVFQGLISLHILLFQMKLY